jgi:ribosome-associated protein
MESADLNAEALRDIVVQALDDAKAQNVTVLDVRGLTSITDFMVIATGTSDRHVRTLADRVAAAARDVGVRPIGVEGEQQGQWVLVDLSDVILHAMQAETRDFYQLEKLWGDTRRDRQAGVSAIR